MERVVVVGGGIAGAGAAHRLAAAGASVVLIDRADPGQATSAGAGIVAPGISKSPPGPWFPLAAEAARFYGPLLERLREDGETDTGYEIVGGLFVATTEDEAGRLDEVRALIEDRARSGVPNLGTVSRLGPEEVGELLPVGAPGTEAVHVSGGARVDGRRIRDAMRNAAAHRGAELRHGSASLVVGGGRIHGVEVDGERIGADAVVLAPGAWAGRLLQPAGLRVPVGPQRGQIVHLEMPSGSTGGWPFVVGFHTHYLVSFPERRVVAGATREDGTGFDLRLTAGGTREVLAEALRIAPGLGAARVLEWRIGFRPMSPDGLPLIGPLEGLGGAVLVTGLGPSGLTMGPFAGALAADLVLGRAAPLDLAPYRPERFA